MKDLHSQINPIVEMFARDCALHQIPHYYHGHSHHSRGIDMTFELCCLTTVLFYDLKRHFDHFTISCDYGHVTISIRLFEDDDLPF